MEISAAQTQRGRCIDSHARELRTIAQVYPGLMLVLRAAPTASEAVRIEAATWTKEARLEVRLQHDKKSEMQHAAQHINNRVYDGAWHAAQHAACKSALRVAATATHRHSYNAGTAPLTSVVYVALRQIKTATVSHSIFCPSLRFQSCLPSSPPLGGAHAHDPWLTVRKADQSVRLVVLL